MGTTGIESPSSQRDLAREPRCHGSLQQFPNAADSAGAAWQVAHYYSWSDVTERTIRVYERCLQAKVGMLLDSTAPST